MNDRELLELIAAQVGTITNDMQGLKEEFKGVKEEFKGVKEEVKGIKEEVKGIKEEFKGIKEEVKEVKEKVAGLEGRMIRMEETNHKNFTALFDGYKQNSEKLNTIEAEVSYHEEVILRRIR